jgi:tight adherence protein B
MTSAFIASALVMAALLLILPTRARALHRLTAKPPSHPHLLHRRLLAARLPSRHRVLLLAPLSAFAALALGMQFLVSALAMAVVVSLVLIERTQHRRRTTSAARRAQIIEALDILAADLTAGRPPIDALEGAAVSCSDFQVAYAAAKLGGDVPGALEIAAESPGAGGLRALSAAWGVAEESGAAFAALTERLAESLRADEAIHRQTAASLAGARSTGRILALLPVFGIALGYSLGAKPLTFLTATPIGWFCLTAGLGLTTLGLRWTTRLAEVHP